MFPTLSEAVTGARLTVGPPFYTQWMLPIGFILLILTGVGPLLAWRRSTVSNLLYQFTWPVLLAVATMGGLYAAGFRVWVSGLCFGLCAFVCGAIGQEFVRGAYVRRRATGTDIFTALIGLVARSRRRYGGNIVHVGIVLMFLGFAGSGYKLDSQLLLRPGQETEIGRYTVRYDRLTEISDARKQMITAYMTVLVDGETVAQLHPARWYFFKHEDQPTTEVAMRHTVAEDLYIVLAGFDMADQAASFQITVNPLVNWIWIGFSVLALGTVIALLPESAFAFAGATAPRGAATASMLLLAAALSVMGPVTALAQPLVGAVEDATEASPLEIDLTRSLVCMCGTQGCGKKLVAECVCSEAVRMRAGDQGPGRRRADPRRSAAVLHRQARQPGAAGGAAQRGLQSAGVVLPVSAGHDRGGGAGGRARSLDAGWSAPANCGRPGRPRRRRGAARGPSRR